MEHETLFWKDFPSLNVHYRELLNDNPNTHIRRVFCNPVVEYDLNIGYFVVENNIFDDVDLPYILLWFSSKNDKNFGYHLGWASRLPAEKEVRKRYEYLLDLALSELNERKLKRIEERQAKINNQ